MWQLEPYQNQRKNPRKEDPRKTLLNKYNSTNLTFLFNDGLRDEKYFNNFLLTIINIFYVPWLAQENQKMTVSFSK